MFKKFERNKDFYKSVLVIAVPMMIQNGITNFVSLLDNLMVGQVGTLQMSGVSIANQLLFISNLTIFGGLAGAGIFASAPRCRAGRWPAARSDGSTAWRRTPCISWQTRTRR